jgi:secreted protein with Ig-like and vWFA domain
VVDVDHQHQRRLTGAGDAVDLARQGELEVAPVGQPGERIATRELTQAVDHRLQPGNAVALPIGQDVAGLLQQLERTVEAERRTIVDRGIDLEGA